MAEGFTDARRTPAKDAGYVFNDHPEIFETFDRESNQKAEEVRGIIEGIAHFPSLVARIQDRTRPLRILFIGPGSGKVEVPLLTQVSQQRGSQGNIIVEGIDPATATQNEFRENLQTNGLDEIETNLRWHENRFEDFTSSEEYDLVVANQSFHYVGDRPNSLRKMRSLVGNEGASVIVMQAKEGDVNSARDMLHMTSSLTGNPKSLEPSSEKVAFDMAMINLNGRYSRKEWELDVSSLFQGHQGRFNSPDEMVENFNPNETGKNLLSFLIRESWDDTTDAFKELFKQNFIKNWAYSFTEVDADGSLHWDGLDDFIWITDLEPVASTQLRDSRFLIPGDQGNDIREAAGLEAA